MGEKNLSMEKKLSLRRWRLVTNTEAADYRNNKACTLWFSTSSGSQVTFHKEVVVVFSL